MLKTLERLFERWLMHSIAKNLSKPDFGDALEQELGSFFEERSEERDFDFKKRENELHRKLIETQSELSNSIKKEVLLKQQIEMLEKQMDEMNYITTRNFDAIKTNLKYTQESLFISQGNQTQKHLANLNGEEPIGLINRKEMQTELMDLQHTPLLKTLEKVHLKTNSELSRIEIELMRIEASEKSKRISITKNALHTEAMKKEPSGKSA